MFKNLNTSALGISGHQSELIELVLTHGFQGMDVKIKELAHRAQKHGMPYARRLIDSAGIQLGSFELPLEWDTNDDIFKEGLAKLPEYVQVAAEIGCTRCLATIEPAGDMRPYHENFEFHRHRFSDICKVLEPSGIRLAIGFRAAADLRKDQAFQFIHELDALLLLVKMVDAPNVGILLDIWDLHVSGGSVQNVRTLSAEQIVVVRVADLAEGLSADEPTEASRILPDPTGQVGVSAYLTALAELSYDGPITPAPYRGTFTSSRRDPIVRQTADALRTAWEAAGLTPTGKLAVPAES